MTAVLALLGFLIVGTAGPDWLHVTMIGDILLWVAAILTVVTGYDYLRVGIKHMADGQSY